MAEQVLEASIMHHQNMGVDICRAMRNEAVKLGFDPTLMPQIDWEKAKFSLNRDPIDGNEYLSGVWNNDKGHRIGSVQFNSDGSFYAEYDIVKNHPKDKRWFVEAVTAWGRDRNIKTEPRLLEAV